MNVRALSLIATFAAFAPVAAYADAPSGDFAAVIGPQAAAHAAPELARADNRNYVEGNFEQLIARKSTVTIEQVRRGIAAAPLPVVGA
jgi:hypothetical protein